MVTEEEFKFLLKILTDFADYIQKDVDIINVNIDKIRIRLNELENKDKISSN